MCRSKVPSCRNETSGLLIVTHISAEMSSQSYITFSTDTLPKIIANEFYVLPSNNYSICNQWQVFYISATRVTGLSFNNGHSFSGCNSFTL